MTKQEAGRWEQFAQEDAEFYIRTEGGSRPGPEERAAFFASGRADFAEIVGEAAPHLGERRGTAVEIGCGVGRLSLAAAAEFARVRAVDISPTMRGKLEANARAAAVANVEAFAPEAGWDAGEPVDLVYSRWVLQHIESWEIIAGYVRRIAGCLHAQGVAHLQFDTRPRSAAYRLRNALPDPVLPRTWRRGIRRIRRDADEVRALFRGAGLEVRAELRPGTEEHVFVVGRAG